jgi:hypothetical protein
MKPIVVSNNGNTHDLAVKETLNKLKHPRQYTWPFEQPLIC